MKELNKVINPDEQIFWGGFPEFWPYYLSIAVPSVVAGSLWLALLSPFVSVVLNPSANAMATSLPLFAYFFMSFFILPGLWLVIGVPIWAYILHKHLHYVITNKRLIIQSGIIGRDFHYVDFDQITNAEVRVGFWDKIVGKNSGSIIVSSAGQSAYSSGGQKIAGAIRNISDPYEVFKFFKKVSYDVKTDIEYPNKFRPAENHGYHSQYDPNKDQI
jgi:hypothetical protein